MPTPLFRVLLLGCFLLLGLPGCYSFLPTAAGQLPASPRPNPVYTRVQHMPELLGGGGVAAITAALQQGIVLPFGTPVPAANSLVVVRFVVGTVGEVGEANIVRGLSPAVDQAVLGAVHRLPRFSAGMQGDKYVQVAFTLTVRAPGAATPTERREAHTRWQQTAVRLPGEADSTFVRRVLPLSYSAYSRDLVAYAWRPSPFGKQLFFSTSGIDDNEYGSNLFVLDPFQPNTYAVQVLRLESMGDLTTMASLFFADANRDGRKELLALVECSLRDQKEVDGQLLDGHWTHYRTDSWQYVGPDKAGRPQYRQDAYRAYLDELPTAAAVRQALARHQRPRRPAAAKPPK